jgi:hypothetical protein
VHAGFYRNVRATRYEVMRALHRALDGRSVHEPLDGQPDDKIGEGLEALYITGHSLGGAMAAMTAAMLRHESKFRRLAERLRAVYTFGLPMIGDPSFARACQRDDFLREHVFRYVNDNDVVPHLPPKTSGPFRHFGREYIYRVPYVQQLSALTRLLPGCAYEPPTGEWSESATPTAQMPSALGLARRGVDVPGPQVPVSACPAGDLLVRGSPPAPLHHRAHPGRCGQRVRRLTEPSPQLRRPSRPELLDAQALALRARIVPACAGPEVPPVPP